MVACRRILAYVFFPLVAMGVGMMRQGLWPRALEDVLGTAAGRDNLVAECACLGQDGDVEGVGEVVVVDDWSSVWIGALEADSALAAR